MVPVKHSSSIPGMSSDGEDWTMGVLIEVEEERVGLKRRLRASQASCHPERRQVPENMSEPVSLVV